MRIFGPASMVLCVAALSTGCSQVYLGERGAGRTHLYAGAVRVSIPETVGDVRAINVSTLGVGMENGVFLGWRRGQYVFARPGECQLLIVIRSRIETEHALRILEAAEGEQLCVVDFSDTLRLVR